MNTKSGLKRWWKQAAVVGGVTLLAGCDTGYNAQIMRTEGGVPHIVAEDFGSVGFGTGYAAAQDNVCFLAENFLKYTAQKAQYFGPGERSANITSDLFYKFLAQTGTYDASVSPELQATFEGYAAGYNRYLRDTGVANLPPRCQNAEWVQEVSADTIRSIHLTPFFLPNFHQLVVAAKPPVAVSKAKGAKDKQAPPLIAAIETPAMNPLIGNPQDKGSNGVAIGSDLAQDANALLFANPHLDWKEDGRFWPMHQMIPGVTNMLGANIIDRAHVGFGTNGDVAWTNTVSKSQRFSFFHLTLVPGQPTTYMFDGAPRQMKTDTVTIQLKTEYGLVPVNHTFYSTHFGLLVGGAFPWNDYLAIALRVAGEDERGMNGGAIELQQVKTVDDLLAVNAKYQFTPVNTIAADKTGQVLFLEGGPVAGVSDAQQASCWSPWVPGTLVGSSSDCQWTEYEDAAVPGLLSPSLQPSLIRKDYVTNSNDTAWLSNPNEPLTGYPLITGTSGTQRTLRTRSGLRMVAERIDGTDGLGTAGFTRDQLLDIMMSNQHYVGQILRDDMVTLCNNNPSVDVEGTAVDISAACPVLANWDLAANLDSRGAHLMRETLVAANGGAFSRTLPTSFNYAVPFDAANPLTTPRGLDVENNPAVLQALAVAVTKLNNDGIALDARLGDIQSVTRNGVRIPLHGGEEYEGVFNKMSLANQGEAGYPEVTGSSASWVLAAAMTDYGPKVKALLSYSVSTDPDSPHFSDMTQRFSEKAFIEIPYHLWDVKAQAQSVTTITEGSDDCEAEGWQSFASLGFSDEAACVEHFETVYANRLTDFVLP